ncbi:MAG: response regulator, partial [Candidatus Riflebacteria bacterium]
PGNSPRKALQQNVDQKIALFMGLMLLVLMIIVLVVSNSLFNQLQKEYNNRLSTALASTISESITRVGFSGRFHTRKLVKELYGKEKSLAYISVETYDNMVFAHSDASLNDLPLSEIARAEKDLCMNSSAAVILEKKFAGQTINEILTPFRGGIDDEILGIVRIGIDFTDLQNSKTAILSKLLFLIVILTFFSILAAYKLSRFFGKSIRELASQLQGILAHAPMGMVISRVDGSIANSSKETAIFFPNSESALTVNNMHQSIDDQRSIDKLNELEKKAFAGNDYLQENLEVNGDSQKPSFWDISKFPIALDEQGKSSLICSFYNDITGKITSENERTALQEQLLQAQKMDAVGQLAGGVAHDFNNLLSAILSAAELLQNIPSGSEKHKKFVEMIISTTCKAADLTKKLLTFARKQEHKRKLVDIKTIINDSCEIFKRTFDPRISVAFENNADSTMVIGDEALMQSVIMNLGINSSQAMPNGGNLEISLRNVVFDDTNRKFSKFEIVPGRFVEICVKDTGTGIPKELQDRIFEPFFTTKAQGKGTGLGLAMVYGAIKVHNGAITLASETGKGTIFNVFIPVADSTPEVEDNTVQLIRGSGKILLVDDEEGIRILVGEMLRTIGYEVILARNGIEAVDIFRKNSTDFSLVILDMMMPEMNGKTAVTELKKIRSDCAIILVSGFVNHQDLDDIMEMGISGFLKKPFRLADLSQAITRATDPSQTKTEK